MVKLIKYLKPYTLAIIASMLLLFGQVAANLKLPDYMAQIINNGVVPQNMDVVKNVGAQMILVALLGAVCTIGVSYLASRISTGFGRDLRAQVFTKVEGFAMKEFDKFSTASLITRSTNDITQIQQVTFMILRMVLSAPLMGIGAIIQAYAKAPSMSWIIGLAVAVVIVVISILFYVALPKFKLLQKMVDKLNLVTREILTGLRVIRAFNTQPYEEKKFDRTNVDLTKLNLFVNRLMVVLSPIMMLVMNFTAIGIIWVGAHLINTGDLQIGDMMAFMQYALQVIMSFLFFSMIFIMIPRAAVSGDRIAEVLEVKPEIHDPKVPELFDQDKKGLVEFNNVSFSYPDSDTPVLKDITFSAQPGETTAFIGSTGCGKSTLINLIPRFYDVSAGSVKVDGHDVRNVPQKDLHNKIGYVPQRGVLFSGTVSSNIKYGVEHASAAEVEKAATTAQALGFIDKMEHKFETPIAQGGTNVSGGQKQRLSIARAIVRNPEIYIFDDSFSALDFKTDAALRQALAHETAGATVLIVSQRISTIMHAAKIVVLEEGRIVGMGSHHELLKDCEVYKEIAESQLSQVELAQTDRIVNANVKEAAL